MVQVIFVHGINNEKNSKEKIERDWARALQDGAKNAGLKIPDNIKFTAAFYGDILKTETDSWGKQEKKLKPITNESPSYDYDDTTVSDLYRDYQHSLGISDSDLFKYLDNSDSENAITVEGAGIHKKWLKAIVRALEDVIPTKGKFLARVFLKQAAAYLHKGNLKEKIDSLVYEQAFETIDKTQKTIIISHSLGTIVAYTLLREFQKEIPVELFITAGSPLGIEIAKKRLGPPLAKPAGVKKWLNIADSDDFVALHKRLTVKTFGTSNIINIANLDNGHADPHSIIKYLSHERVIKHILKAM